VENENELTCLTAPRTLTALRSAVRKTKQHSNLKLRDRWACHGQATEPAYFGILRTRTKIRGCQQQVPAYLSLVWGEGTHSRPRNAKSLTSN
jgi:hypothetical protein